MGVQRGRLDPSMILDTEYEQCTRCNGDHHRDEMRGLLCKWCDAELGGEG